MFWKKIVLALVAFMLGLAPASAQRQIILDFSEVEVRETSGKLKMVVGEQLLTAAVEPISRGEGVEVWKGTLSFQIFLLPPPRRGRPHGSTCLYSTLLPPGWRREEKGRSRSKWSMQSRCSTRHSQQAICLK